MWLALVCLAAGAWAQANFMGEVCDRAAKTCQVHPSNGPNVNNLAAFLVEDGSGPMDDSGWTLLVNPCFDFCVPGVNCTTCSERYEYVSSTLYVVINNVTIRSLTTQHALFAVTVNTSESNLPVANSIMPPLLCAWLLVDAFNFTLGDIDFNLDACTVDHLTQDLQQIYSLEMSQTPLIIGAAQPGIVTIYNTSVTGASTLVRFLPLFDTVTQEIELARLGPNLVQATESPDFADCTPLAVFTDFVGTIDRRQTGCVIVAPRRFGPNEVIGSSGRVVNLTDLVGLGAGFGITPPEPPPPSDNSHKKTTRIFIIVGIVSAVLVVFAALLICVHQCLERHDARGKRVKNFYARQLLKK